MGQQWHFFEAGYYAGALLSEQSVRAATKYVDLTPFLPMLDKWLEVCPASALRERVRENSARGLERYLPRSRTRSIKRASAPVIRPDT